MISDTFWHVSTNYTNCQKSGEHFGSSKFGWNCWFLLVVTRLQFIQNWNTTCNLLTTIPLVCGRLRLAFHGIGTHKWTLEAMLNIGAEITHKFSDEVPRTNTASLQSPSFIWSIFYIWKGFEPNTKDASDRRRPWTIFWYVYTFLSAKWNSWHGWRQYGHVWLSSTGDHEIAGVVSQRKIVLCPRPDGFAFKTGISCPRSDSSNCFLQCPENWMAQQTQFTIPILADFFSALLMVLFGI